MKIKTLGMAAFLLAAAGSAQAQPFDVSDIRVEGLKRVSAASVFNAFPVSASDTVSERELADAARELFATGLFDDVSLAREGDVLVVKVVERPTIARLDISGNDQIKEEDLRKGLSEAGLSEGQVLELSTLEEIQRELESVYQAQGRYSARIDANVEEVDTGRVKVNIDINEGDVAKIHQINIVGNSAFDDDTLRDLFELEDRPGWFFGWFSSDEYSREALSGDIERLRSYYLDRGYANFEVTSTQVSIGPEKTNIYITLNVDEGQQYQVGDIRFDGDLTIAESEARKLLQVERGQRFSRSKLNDSSEALRQRLGAEGFAFAEVNSRPEMNADGTVDLVLNVEPGRRTYVRRIEFRGNTTTQDEVLRREMTQMEGAPASTDSITQSRQRLNRLGFFSQVEVDTRRVPGEPDKLDVTYDVEEQPSGSISASIGFSQSAGVIYGASLSQKNFLGTGNRVNLGAQRSDTFTSVNFGFTDPYWTINGVSRGYNVFYRETDYEDSDISTYSTDSFGAGINFGYPISELSRLNFGASAEDLKVKTYYDTASEIERYVDDEGDSASTVKLTASWTRNNLNRGTMPTDGSYQRIALETAAPGSDVGYYKLRAKVKQLFALDEDDLWSLKFSGNLGYADAFGGDPFPFYENFYAGGLGSVRGFTSNTLGQRTTPKRKGGRDRTLGGNARIEGSAAVLFPLPFIEDQDSMQTSLFVDGGNTFLTSCYDVLDGDKARQNCSSGIDMGDLRYSAGMGLSWLTPVGPLTFSVAKPINDKSEDDTEFFQFSLGQSF
ncbi:outer membrane protein assembly factor BamA [Vreelandella jeotgali]|uniref:outer membrane protein assembly factor BamA n=1 Tax=Vreelandella jeotgali TaxID=553386 RepID=UPI00034A6057